jgi:hypothetical protein
MLSGATCAMIRSQGMSLGPTGYADKNYVVLGTKSSFEMMNNLKQLMFVTVLRGSRGIGSAASNAVHRLWSAKVTVRTWESKKELERTLD